MRLWECSLAGCIADVNNSAAASSFAERCVRQEVSSGNPKQGSKATRPASLLRRDLPAALFNGGRCTSPTVSERPLYPPLPASLESDPLGRETLQPDVHGFRREGFSGHRVTQSGVGWILSPTLPRAYRDVAFGHDAWEMNSRRMSPCARDCRSDGWACCGRRRRHRNE